MERHVMKKARRASAKFHGKGPHKRTAADDEKFAQKFERLQPLREMPCVKMVCKMMQMVYNGKKCILQRKQVSISWK